MKDKDIGSNFSSGAEKVERVSAESGEEQRKESYETKAAENRIEAAENRMQAKAAKNRLKEEKAQARAAQKEAKARAFEREVAAIEKERKEKQEKRRKGGSRPDGIGGWIAAVVTLGAATLILTAVVTLGAINAYRTNNGIVSSYRGTTYEFIASVEEVEGDLDKIRLSTSPRVQGEILTDLLVQSRVAEADLEKMPLSFEKDEKLMGFLNGTSKMAERMLEKLAAGEKLDERDLAMLEKTYEAARAVRTTLDELAANVKDDDFMGMMKEAKNAVGEAFDKIENGVRELEEKLPPKEMKPPMIKQSKEENGGEKKEKLDGISSAQAEELCRRYFADYGVQTLEYAGELQGRGMQAYNFAMTDEEGTRLFAQISKQNGAIVRFDYYKECTKHTKDIRTAKAIAETFLEKLGYENMTAVDVEEEGTNADFTFVYEANGCVYYPDEVTVKVCEERGMVVGLDASKFLQKHRGRDALNVKLTEQEAQKMLSEKISVDSSRLVLFERKGREQTAYEFFGGYQENYYFVYVDANSGEEIAVLNAKDHDR